MLTRRTFLGSLSVSGALAQTRQPVSWADRPMRWGQLTLVDNDPGTYDARWWIDYFKRTHCDAVCLSAGGSICYYPTAIPYHYRSKWMKDGTDPFGELVDGCRKASMVIVARVDPHSIRDEAAEAHPEWVAVDVEGKPRRHWAAPERWVTCALGPYNFQFTTGVIHEIVQKYKVAGVFANRWQGHGICYCENCRRQFPLLDRTRDPKDTEAKMAWARWRHNRLLQLWDVWDDAIRAENPDACFIANAGGGASSDFDMVTIGRKSSMMAADRQSRDSRVVPVWINGRNGKEYRAAAGLKPVVGIFSIGRDDNYRWKDSVHQGDEIRSFAHDGIAQGLRPWFTKFAGQIFDKRWVPVVEQIYDWHWRNEKYLRNTENLARAAIVLSQQTARRQGAGYDDHELGFYQALVESRIPFEMLHEDLLDQAGRFRLLILPNVVCLSQKQCDQLAQFVQNGGRVVAAFETSLQDETGRARPDFGLAPLFGVKYGGEVHRVVKNSYMRIDASTKHPLIRGLEDTGRIINTMGRVEIDPASELDAVPVTLIPSYPDLPMEEVYPRQPETNIPDVCLRTVGKGRVVYFPGDIGRTFWQILDGDHLKLIRNAVDWALDEEAHVRVEGQGVLDIAWWRQKDSLALHLVNLTNPMMMKGPVRELWPSGELRVRLQIGGAKPKRVRLLTAGVDPKYTLREGVLELTVAPVQLHEVVAIDL